jgi:hypothetical protein
METLVDNIPYHIARLWPELVENDDLVHVIYCGRNIPNGGFVAIDNVTVANEINRALIQGKAIIVFNNAHETLTESEITKVHQIIALSNISSNDNVYYLTSSNDGVVHYETLCDKNNWQPLQLVILPTFEYFAIDLSRVNHASREYIVENKPKKYLCLNRRPHLHRVSLLGMLSHKDLVSEAHYSYYDDSFCKSLLADTLINEKFTSESASCIFDGIEKIDASLPLRLTLDQEANNPDGVTNVDEYLFSETYFSLITETFFFSGSHFNELNTVFMSEKTFNAILMKHPFIILGTPHSLDHLRHLGYRTFSPYINEDYDLPDSDENRMLKIVTEIERLCNMSDIEWLDWQQNVKEIVDHNYNNLVERRYGPINNVQLGNTK